VTGRAPGARRHLAAAALAAAALAAAPGAASAAARPTYGGELRVALPLPPRVDDPALATQPQDLALARALHATPLVLGPGGRLAPGLLAEIPTAQPGDRTFRLVLRPGLRFADGTPLGAGDLATSLARLLRPEVASPHAWLALAIQGAEAVLEGRASSLSGVQVLSDRELLVTLAFPFPQFPAALAALPAAVTSAAGAGAGPFRPESRERLAANPFHWRGRPFGDALALSWPDPRAAARALEAGALDLSLRPEPSPGAVVLPLLTATYAAVNGRRLGDGATVVRLALAGLDRTDLARRFVRSPAAPLERLLPPAILPQAAQPDPPARPAAAERAPARLVVLVPGWLADPRAVAERLQVKLFDAGLRAALEPLDQARYAARLAAGDWDLAVVSVPLLTTQPALAAGQVALAVAGPGAARRAEQALAALDGEALGPAVEALRVELDLWPLYAAGGRAAPGPALRGLEVRPDGGFDAGDLWRLGAPR
jgi:peptide/nickel transport system substrate-binding protein